MNLREKYNLKQTCKTNQYRVHTQATYVLHVLAPIILLIILLGITNKAFLISCRRYRTPSASRKNSLLSVKCMPLISLQHESPVLLALLTYLAFVYLLCILHSDLGRQHELLLSLGDVHSKNQILITVSSISLNDYYCRKTCVKRSKLHGPF
jgi:hypothetical protein